MIGFLLSPLGRSAAAVLGIVAFLVAFAVDQRSKGAASAVAKIERQTDAVIDKANAVRATSATGRGVRDPHAID